MHKLNHCIESRILQLTCSDWFLEMVAYNKHKILEISVLVYLLCTFLPPNMARSLLLVSVSLTIFIYKPRLVHEPYMCMLTESIVEYYVLSFAEPISWYYNHYLWLNLLYSIYYL